MITYYIEENDKIVLSDTDRERLLNTLEFMPQYQGLEILETEDLVINGVIMTQEEYEAYQATLEAERVNNLKMTAQDLLFKYLKDTLHVPIEILDEYLQKNVEFRLRLTTCQDVFCGVVKQACPIKINGFAITSELVEALFLHKNGELSDDDLEAILHPVEEPITTPEEGEGGEPESIGEPEISEEIEE